MARRWRGRAPGLCLLCVALATWTSSSWLAARAQQPPAITVTDGQQLADECAAFGRHNADMTLVLPAGTLSLETATFTDISPAAKPFSAGVLTLQGQGNVTVLDTGMRAGMLSGGLRGAKLVLKDLTLSNLCIEAAFRSGLPTLLVDSLPIFGLSATHQALTHKHTVFYTLRSILLSSLYRAAVQRSTWPVVRAAFDLQMSSYPDMQISIGRMDRWTIRAISANVPAYFIQDMLVKSVEDPDDPLLQAQRRAGTLMAPRFCNGSLVPEDLAENNDALWGQVWVEDEEAATLVALAQAAQVAEANLALQPHLPVPAVQTNAQRVDLSVSKVPGGGLRLAGPLQLWGPFNDDPTDLMPVPVLDLCTRTSPLFNLSGEGQLFITRLTLALNASSPSCAASSALMFTSLASTSTSNASADTWRADAPIQLHNVTVVLPVQDYLALLVLATDGVSGASLRGCMDGQTLRLAAQLSSSIYQLTAQQQQPVASLWKSLLLTTYTGWGVNATDLLLQPAGPVPVQLVDTCTPANAPADSDDSSSGFSAANMSLIIGCIIGGALVLAVLVAAAWFLVWNKMPSWHHAPSTGQAPDANSSLKAPSPSKHSLTHPCGDALLPVAVDVVVAASAAVQGPTSASSKPLSGTMLSLLQSAETQLLAHTDTQALLGSASHAGGSSPSAAAAAAPAPRGGLADAQARAASASAGPPNLLDLAHGLLLSSLHSQRPPLMLSTAVAAAAAAGWGSDKAPSPAGGARSAGSSGAAAAAGAAGRHCNPLAQVKEVAAANAGLQAAAKLANRVVIHDVLGSGGSGTVYLGEWRGLPVAVKTMVYEANLGDEYTPAVMETAIAASMGHRNVVATYHFDIKLLGDQAAHRSAQAQEGLQVTHAGPPDTSVAAATGTAGSYKVFLVQELCQSCLQTVLDLECLKADRQGPGQQVGTKVITYTLLLHMATGLEYLHKLNIIHGDLTPSNVLLKLDTSEPSGVVAKLADFGLSRCLEPLATHVSNVAAGTPFYVAPEVVHMRRKSPASDIYSFGVIMGLMVTKTCPYTTSPEDGLRRLDPAFPDFTAAPHVPAQMQELVCRCLSPVPEQRPLARQLVLALGELVLALQRDASSASLNGTSPPMPPPPPYALLAPS